MPGAAVRTETTPRAGEAAAAIDLSEIERTGAVRFGRPVARVVVIFADGKRASVDLPEPAAPPAGGAGPEDDPLTPMQQAVIDVIAGMAAGDLLTFDEIAAKAGYANTDKLREWVRQTAAVRGDLKQSNRGWRKS